MYAKKEFINKISNQVHFAFISSQTHPFFFSGFVNQWNKINSSAQKHKSMYLSGGGGGKATIIHEIYISDLVPKGAHAQGYALQLEIKHC